MNPGDRISTIKGIGAKTESHLARIGIYTVGDMAEHYPREYHAYDTPVSIENTEYDNRRQSGYRVIFSETPKLLKRGRTPIVSVMLHAGNASVQVVWYHSPYVRQQLKPGCTVILYGKITSKGSRRMLDHPDIYTEDQYALLQKSLQPVYGLTEGLTQNFFMKTMHSILDSGLLLPDPLPADIRRQYQLSEYNYALRQIHFPENEEACRMARKRLVFDEFLVFALSVKQLKKENHQIENHYQIQESAAVSQLIASLPYHLTKAQLRVWHEIEEDMKSPVVMNRLVQGDVGSGKTMIAALAMFAAAKAGFQSCMMAPTEVLARQHYETFQKLCEEFGLKIPVVLLTGSMTARQKRMAYEALQLYPNAMVVGTHALIQERAIYDNLALVITDEQHRFGVRQREIFAEKGRHPHILVMSATPIPRTLAIILYGDLDISVVDEVPAKRLPVKNCVVNTGYRNKAYAFIENEVKNGHQAYVICPLVEEVEGMETENATDYVKKLRQIFPEEIQLGLLHGQMKPAQKNKVMEAFMKNEVQVLVATTVVEVGVNVPNATVMMIENAERFGLAQLHQLRGRVGRGDAQSYCIMVNCSSAKTAERRLKILNDSNDGFRIASEDLKLRGPGDFFGIRQSGELQFALGDIYQDAAVLRDASEAVGELLGEDPDLMSGEHENLRHYLEAFLMREQNQMSL